MNKVGLLASTVAAAALAGCLGQPTEISTALRVDRIEVASDGVPYFVGGDLGQVTGPIDDVARVHAAIAGVLPAIADTLGVPSSDLVATGAERDELGMTHVRLAQQKNGLRVVGGDVIVHVGADGMVSSANGTARDRALTATPSLAAEDAARVAVKTAEVPVEALRSELTYVVSNHDGELYLAWEVAVGSSGGALVSDLVYVDALTGNVVDHHPQLFTLKNRTVNNGGGGSFPVANAPVIGTENAPPTDPVALAAFTNTGITYDCYKTLFNRDSYNNLGATLTSQVHVVFPGPNGQTSPNNAVWSPQVSMMAYGDGDGIQMKQLAYALDVTAHELTHAVTSSTANLVYQDESGALNEGLSDIMASVCEAFKAKAVTANTWLVGEDIWTPAKAGDALRYMDSPTKDGSSPDFYPERYVGPNDFGGVHSNSGLPNLAFYLLSAGGKHPRAKTPTTVPGVGIDKAGAIFQRALTTKFTPNTNMAQARTLTEQSAQELYPGTCAKTSVALAWATVGVGTAPTDTVLPTVAITSPATGARVAAGFQVQVTTADDQCIQKVELLVDGTVAQTLTAAPYTFTTDAALTSGSHMIQVKTYDAFNQAVATSMVSVSGGGTGTGGGNGNGDGGGDVSNDVTGGCNTGGGGMGLGLGLGLLGLVLRRRR